MRHLLKQQVTEGLGELAVLHQQEMPQRLKMSLELQLHKEVVNHGLVHQGDAAGGGKDHSLGSVHQGDAGGGLRARGVCGGQRAMAGWWEDHSLGGQWGREGAVHEHGQCQELAQLHGGLICG